MMSNYSPSALLSKEPAAVAAAVNSILPCLILLGVLELSVDQVAAIVVALNAALGLFVRASSTPTAVLEEDLARTLHVSGISEDDLNDLELDEDLADDEV